MRKHIFFIGILTLMAVARFAILFQAQTHVHSDEAIIGLMGKHILDEGYYPFYMYGQPYNACAAWEAYLAAISFAIFGVGVVPLKGCIVVLSLVCLGLFYRMALHLYDQRTATLAALVFALSPSLLKWHFQVRGYSLYFLSIPILVVLFAAIASDVSPKTKKILLFGLMSGLSIWCLELVLPLVAALWILLALRRKLSLRNAAIGMAGVIIGYAPVIVFNLTHHFSNWQSAFLDKANSGGLSALFRFSTLGDIFLREMPKFFGVDTVFWYYQATPRLGVVFYVIAWISVVVAVLPFFRTPSKILQVLRGDLQGNDAGKDLLMLVLMAACFIPYLTVPIRVPGYFLGGCFFLSVLTGRLLARCFAVPAILPRILGTTLLSVILLGGVAAMMVVEGQNQIETLVLSDSGNGFHPTRIPGRDIEAVERHLHQNRIVSVWTTVPFIYPLLFETEEKLAVSGTIFGWDHRVCLEVSSGSKPDQSRSLVFVIETNSPLRPQLEAWCARAAGIAPLVTGYGTLTVIEVKQPGTPVPQL
jgi:4-amino-4-deoxy-L-arabinose transferase-like glycosyltransferase